MPSKDNQIYIVVHRDVDIEMYSKMLELKVARNPNSKVTFILSNTLITVRSTVENYFDDAKHIIPKRELKYYTIVRDPAEAEMIKEFKLIDNSNLAGAADEFNNYIIPLARFHAHKDNKVVINYIITSNLSDYVDLDTGEVKPDV